MRVVVIGAQRRRQGIGEFVARFFEEEGATVSGIVATTAERARETCAALATRYGIRANGYGSLDAALRAEKPDAVAICSPYAVHAEHLEATARAGAHCFCEKPLWFDPALDPASETRRLIEPFLARELHLELVTQWPCLLEDFFALFPEERGRPVRSFSMLLCPGSAGTAMVPDAVPHPVSVLQALVGAGSVQKPRAWFLDQGLGDQGRELRIECEWRHVQGSVAVELHFATKEEAPRPASFTINGRTAHRRIVLPTYSMTLESEERGGAPARTRPVADPARRLVRGFLERATARTPTRLDLLVDGQEALLALYRAVDAVARPPKLKSASTLRKVS